MTAVTPEVSALTEEEISTIGRFLRVLNDLGVQAILMDQVLGYSNCSEAATRNLLSAILDIRNTSPSEMHEAGVSLDFVVELANGTGAFPDDFLPSQETVSKCVSAFWELHRYRSS